MVRLRLRTLTSAAAVLVVASIVLQPVFAQDAPAVADEAAVRDVVRRYVEARDRRDAKVLESLFTADADQLTTAGEWRQGRDTVVSGSLASSQRNPGARQIAIETVRMITRDVAIADGRYEIAAAGGAAARKMRTTFVLTRAGTVWRIAAIRNMAPTTP
jgi:uncharacterized protein (TIGR02246 family)